jgi:hypothetical protein
MAERAARSSVRLAELLAGLSLAADLGMGQPMEHVLRQCLISLRLAQRLGMDEADREVVYYAALLAWVGCHVDAYEQAKWFGDDTALKADFRRVDFATPVAGPLFMLRHLGAGRPTVERARLGVAFLGDGRRAAEAMLENHWLAADELAARLGLAQRVRDSVEQTFERWDGKGVPKGARGRRSSSAPGWSRWPTWSRSFTAPAGPAPRSRSPGSGAGRSSTRRWSTSSPPRRRRCSRASTRRAAGTPSSRRSRRWRCG